jgi:hypothetical protein
MLTASFVRSRLAYDSATGLLKWLPRVVRCPQDKAWNSRRVGTIAGARNGDGYVEVFLDTRSYKAHHLAWLIEYGQDVPMIDHINGDRSDNRISNLRAATPKQNSWNRKRPRTNTSGVKGVRFNPLIGKWVASIGAHGQRFHLGVFESVGDAALARARAEHQMHGKFSGIICRSSAP